MGMETAPMMNPQEATIAAGDEVCCPLQEIHAAFCFAQFLSFAAGVVGRSIVHLGQSKLRLDQ